MDLLEAFSEVAGRHPDYPAIIHDAHPMAYAELAELAREVARRVGPCPGAVAVAATRSPTTVAALLGIWAAGGTYCPVDPAFPVQRQQFMLDAAGCRVLLTADLEVTAIGSDGPRGVPAAGSVTPAYCLFTSGSTGEPRPVLTPRLAIDTTVAALRDLFGIVHSDRVLQFASLNWDTCFEEILPTITAGASLVFDSAAHSGSFRHLLRMVERESVTVLNLPTAFWHELVNHLVEDGAKLPGCVRLVVIGGEAVNPARLADWCALDTAGVRLVNTYGCTETTLVTHAVDLHGPQASALDVPWGAVARAPIGLPLPHVVERIGDDDELLVGGPSLADGYGGLAEATAARFVGSGAGRFFRTGDRVSRMTNGMLVHEGRIDAQLKIRGIRVDPAEVEAQIAGHPAVGAVAVTGLAVAGRTVLVAHVVPKAPHGAATLDVEIIDYLRLRVPAHLVPSRISIVPELAYTASGKVDRRRIEETVP